MRWRVNIEKQDGKPIENRRIIVTFDPMNEQLVFTCQFKPHNRDWVDFCIEKYECNTQLSIENIRKYLNSGYSIMHRRLNMLNSITDEFSVIKEIVVLEEE